MNTTDWTLYSYFRSSASYRVRIALALKNIDCDQRFIHLIKSGGEQHLDAYTAINPTQLVPTLTSSRGALGQSLAIIEFIDETHPEPRLLPQDPWLRAQVRAFAQGLCCDCQPLINLRVQQYLRQQNFNNDQIDQWLTQWIDRALSSAEITLSNNANSNTFCFGQTPGLADAALIPQVFSAQRFGVDIARYSRLQEIYQYCLSLPAFIKAAPENQADAE